MVKPSRNPPPSPLEFFKIFLSSFSSHQLNLPPAVAVKLNQTHVPKNATLKDNSGKIWDVQLQKTERGLIIRKGWQEFARHHSLVDADFLIFKYDGNSQFYVEVFDRNGLKKGKAKANNKVSSAHTKKEKKTETETEEEGKKSQSTSGCKRKYSEMAPETTPRSGQFGGSHSSFREDVSSSGESQLKLRQTTVEKHGERKMAKAPSFVTPKNPYFVAFMTRTLRYYVYVHRSVLKRHNIKLQKNTQLRDENGKLWPVKINFKKDGRCITINDGWPDFQRNHNVAMHEKIIFEFMSTKDNLCNLIHVQIVRKGGWSQNKKA